MKENTSMTKKYISVAIITMTTVVYFIPYAAYDFYNHFLEAFNVTDGEAGQLLTFFGLTATPGYFIGGWIADKFNPKTCVVASSVLTASVGFAVSFTTSFQLLAILYFVFGITTTCLHWSAFLKVIKSFGTEEEQGRLFGFENTMFGLLGVVCTYLVLGLLPNILAESGFRGGIRIYSMIALAAGLATLFFVPFDSKKKIELGSEDKVDFRLIGKVLHMPITYYLGMFTWGFFMIRSTVPYLNPFMTDAFGVSIGVAAFITNTLRSGVNLIAGPIGGHFIDKQGRSTPIVMVGSIGTLIFTVFLMLVPQEKNLIVLMLGIATILIIFSYLNSSALYTPVTEAKIPFAYVGTVLGVASAIGYSTDIWLYNVCGNMIDNYGNQAYTFIWMMQSVGAIAMIVSGVLLARCYKKAKAKTQNEAIQDTIE